MTKALDWYDANVTSNRCDNWLAIVNLMDSVIRDKIHFDCHTTNREFLAAYCEAHRRNFAEDFIID